MNKLFEYWNKRKSKRAKTKGLTQIDDPAPTPPDAQQSEILKRCAEDVIHWVNTYAITYDPREPESILPFRLFQRQEEFLLWLKEREHNQEDGLAEKCRDVGFTWLCCVYAVHCWLFRSGFKAGFGSRKLTLVDKIGDMDSIFEKIRFLIDHLPAWMRPPGYRRKTHAAFCKIVNPANGAAITGEGGDQIGRGGRTSIYFVDEHAFLPHAKTVEAALSQTSRCKIRVSTPNGVGNMFYALRFGGKLPVFTFRWKDDPRKTQDWYKHQCEILDSTTVAQEIDIDYSAALSGICIPAKWVRAAVGLKLPASGSAVGGWDVADEGKNKNVLITRSGPVITGVNWWSKMDTTQSTQHACRIGHERGLQSLNYDGPGVGAGVRAAFNNMLQQPRFRVCSVNTGSAPTDARWPDGETSTDKFRNLRAELWWKVRFRFEKAYEYVLFLQGEEGGAEHPADEMISLPDNPDLIAQLSLPLYYYTETGKVQIESKREMTTRGVSSPDFADALVLAFAPQPGSWAEVLPLLEALRYNMLYPEGSPYANW